MEHLFFNCKESYKFFAEVISWLDIIDVHEGTSRRKFTISRKGVLAGRLKRQRMGHLDVGSLEYVEPND